MAKTKALTTEQLLALPAAVDLVTAGLAWGLGRTTAHELARRGEFPCAVRRVGNQYRVPKADLLRSLGLHPAPQASEQVPAAS
ncbi:helix-turn-helix domain-containing protein [Nonomuraea sp. NPDC049646]|uniref:helix-turn-helix domain-containing protein n=1 Tax=unclassified Nonomuraea TaxID=2593643 RepID=UPI0037AEF46B